MSPGDIPDNTRRGRGWAIIAFAALSGAGLALGLLPSRPGFPEGRERSLTLYGFSILEETFRDGLSPMFQRDWEAQTAQRLEIAHRFQSLGQLTNELLGGAPATAALLTPEFGARQLIEAGLASAEAGPSLPQGGVFTATPFVLVVRPGNPRGIHDFSDLVQPGVRIVHCDPRTSGGGHWAILAEHGSGWRRSGRWQDGYEQLLGIWRNVTCTGSSARHARALFEAGQGDVLVTYEQDALWGLGEGSLEGQIVYPRSTVLAEVCLVVLERNVAPDERGVVEAFALFLWSRPAQQLLTAHGFRGARAQVDAAPGRFPEIEDPFRIEDLGGWRQVRADILEGAWRRVQRELGR